MRFLKEIFANFYTIGTFGLGWGIGELATKDYKTAAWVLFAVSIFFMIGYFVERFAEGE